jgi:sterigmatocystin biosynthesis cytochrome P450 monooxygenase
MPTFHPVFGHFIALKEGIEKFPRNVTMHVVVHYLSKQFPNGIFYLNLWPFNSKTIMVVSNPVLAAQVESASPALGKPPEMCGTIEVINGGASLMTMHGSTWKRWRGLFNPGFAAGYITQLAPAVAEEVGVFCTILRDLAEKGELVQLEEYSLRLTFDIIARVTLYVCSFASSHIQACNTFFF